MKSSLVVISLFTMFQMFTLSSMALADLDTYKGTLLLNGALLQVTVTQVDKYGTYLATIGTETGTASGIATVPEKPSVLMAGPVDGTNGTKNFFVYIKDGDDHDPVFDQNVSILLADPTLGNKAEISCPAKGNAIVTIAEVGKPVIANCMTLN